MSDDIHSFIVHPVTITHSGARMEDPRRMTHREVMNFMNATNESTGVGIRFALTEMGAWSIAHKHNDAIGPNHNMRYFKVTFRHDQAEYTTIINAPPRS